MCDTAGIIFGALNLKKEEVVGKRVIEVGSADENGSLRPIIEALAPAQYVGIDIKAAPGVDIICDAREMLERFGPESFDLVIASELLEHIKDWRKAISNIKNICRRGGVVLITTRSIGFSYHGYPYDFWRFEVSDMEHIFSDFIIEKVEKDKYSPGVFLKARKPDKFNQLDLSGYQLYSIMLKKRIRVLDGAAVRFFGIRYSIFASLEWLAKLISKPVKYFLKP